MPWGPKIGYLGTWASNLTSPYSIYMKQVKQNEKCDYWIQNSGHLKFPLKVLNIWWIHDFNTLSFHAIVVKILAWNIVSWHWYEGFVLEGCW